MTAMTITEATAQYREVRRATLDKSDPTKGRAERIAALADIARAMPPSNVHPTRRESTGHTFLAGKGYCDECSAGLPNARSLSEPCDRAEATS